MKKMLMIMGIVVGAVFLLSACTAQPQKIEMPEKKLAINEASVQALGHWKVILKPKEVSLQAVPEVNAVDIRCYRDDMICVETLASFYQ
ncbi:MAG TPA: hypothetical protein VK445_02350, partial [Dissulfurispiraceae bacterium]|nr:hypothetical protein [Dissulfurispiraceae bacterium]